MRQSQLFGRTLRETPSEADLPGHRLLLRAGYIRQLMGGSYTLLPLGLRAIKKVEAIIREELDAIGAQELLLPVVQPGDLWRESGRFEQYDVEMVRLRDRGGRDLVLAPTHEEAITDMVRREIRSYRQVPLLVYQLQVKFRDEARPRGGLLRVREFTMQDAYSFDVDKAGLDASFDAVRGAYERIFARCGLQPLAVEASSGMMGGSDPLEFQVLTPAGEDTLVTCPNCGYAANAEVAQFHKSLQGLGDAGSEQTIPAMTEVATPDCTTIEQLAHFMGVPTSATAKAVFFHAPECGLVFAVVRGDHEVNEAKLAALVGASALRPATAEEIMAVGAVPGYASPVGLRGAPLQGGPSVAAEGAHGGGHGGAAVRVVADGGIADGVGGLVAGANRSGYHVRDVVYGRDWVADVVGDIALARAGDPCVRCGTALVVSRSVEVGHIFKLGTRYSATMGARFQDAQGGEQLLEMGCYGIGSGRLLGTIAELHHDERGLVWPAAVAPFDVHLLRLGSDVSVAATADQLYADLRASGVDVLYDDREDAAGVKFNDADLLGLPVRLVVSARGLKAGQVELKRRNVEEKVMLPLADVVAQLKSVR